MLVPLRPLATALALAALPAAAAAPARFPDEGALRRADARYAPVDLRVDLSRLPESERRALARLVEAARVMDAL
ncbi:MAG TPA: hypothetical protein VLC54_14460, partial [Anaeromyxobacter sp.]|nr:hypothetical protein [Anaeromyxobacter sp.]